MLDLLWLVECSLLLVHCQRLYCQSLLDLCFPIDSCPPRTWKNRLGILWFFDHRIYTTFASPININTCLRRTGSYRYMIQSLNHEFHFIRILVLCVKKYFRNKICEKFQKNYDVWNAITFLNINVERINKKQIKACTFYFEVLCENFEYVNVSQSYKHRKKVLKNSKIVVFLWFVALIKKNRS